MSVRTYALVFSLLVIITAVELVITNMQVFKGTTLVTTLIGLAGVKAVFVAMFFQHLKDEPRSLSSLLLGGLVIATMLLIISFLQLHPVHF